MEENDHILDFGALCLCCNHYDVPVFEGLTPLQQQQIEELCKLCIANFKRFAVNC